MEASDSTHEQPPGVAAPAGATVQGGQDDRHLAMLFLGSVLAVYVVIGAAVYGLFTALL